MWSAHEVYLLIVSIMALAYSIVLYRDDAMMADSGLYVHFFAGSAILLLVALLLARASDQVKMLFPLIWVFSSAMMIASGPLSMLHRQHAAVMLMFGVMLMLPLLVRIVQGLMNVASSSSSSNEHQDGLDDDGRTPFIDEDGMVLLSKRQPYPPRWTVSQPSFSSGLSFGRQRSRKIGYKR